MGAAVKVGVNSAAGLEGGEEGKKGVCLQLNGEGDWL